MDTENLLQRLLQNAHQLPDLPPQNSSFIDGLGTKEQSTSRIPAFRCAAGAPRAA
jgi:hypothetical protein